MIDLIQFIILRRPLCGRCVLDLIDSYELDDLDPLELREISHIGDDPDADDRNAVLKRIAKLVLLDCLDILE